MHQRRKAHGLFILPKFRRDLGLRYISMSVSYCDSPYVKLIIKVSNTHALLSLNLSSKLNHMALHLWIKRNAWRKYSVFWTISLPREQGVAPGAARLQNMRQKRSKTYTSTVSEC